MSTWALEHPDLGVLALDGTTGPYVEGFDPGFPRIDSSPEDRAGASGVLDYPGFHRERVVQLDLLFTGSVANRHLQRMSVAAYAARSAVVLRWGSDQYGAIKVDARGAGFVAPIRPGGGPVKARLMLFVPNGIWQSYTASTATVTSGSTTVVNPGGTADTWPVFTIPASASNPSIRNTTTGGRLDLAVTLTAGQTATVDPYNWTVIRSDGALLVDSITMPTLNWNGLRLVSAAGNSLTYSGGGTLSVQYRSGWF